MAVLLLSGLVTQIVGSVGGSNFRRFRGQTVLSNKSMGASKSKLLQNQKLSAIRSIFTRWQTLTDTQRAGWNAEALNYTFPDKFGNLRNLTGREFFTKCNIHLLAIGLSKNSVGSPSSVVPLFTLGSFQIDTSVNEVGLAITSVSASVWLQIRIEMHQKPLNTPTFVRRKIIYVQLVTSPITLNFWNELVAEFPYFENSFNVRAYVNAVNVSGFVGPYSTIDAIVV